MSTLQAAAPTSDQTTAAADRAVLRKLLGQIIVAAIAFVLTAGIWEWAVGRLHARPDVPEPFKTKIDLCLNTPGIDTVFIGSSRYFHGVDPAVFDAETARSGLPTHSYNLGFDALNFLELRFVVNHVLDDPRSKGWRYLFIEPSLRVRLAPGLEHSQRAIILHDASGSMSVAQLILRGNHDWKRKLYWIFEQASVSAVRLTNVGALTNQYVRPQEPPADSEMLAGPAGNGFSGLDPMKATGQKTDQADLDKLMSDQKSAEKTGEARELNQFEIAQLTDLQKLALSHGIKLFLLAPPTATAETYGEFQAVSRAKTSVPTFSFADPVAYFDLYEPKGFVDPDHISSEVAERWTIHAADAFAKSMRSDTSKTPTLRYPEQSSRAATHLAVKSMSESASSPNRGHP